MCYRCGMFFPCARFQDLFHLRERKVAFILAIVEVWRDAHAGFGTVVDDDVPGEEFPANFIGVRAFERNRPGALRRVFRCVHAPAARPGALDQARGHAYGFVADGCDANFVDNIQSGLARIECGNVWSPVQIAEGVLAPVDGASFEVKWAAMRNPPRERGAELSAQIFTDVQISHTRSPTEPLKDSAYRKIDT